MKKSRILRLLSFGLIVVLIAAMALLANGEIKDICEIDAASNNSVNDIRDLREQVNFTPAAAKYRVYIIDEVHMLSIGAFNALLKTLEEPPEHVVFILATTEVHKLPTTILSRCQRFDFRRIEPSKICERIQAVAKTENLTVTDDAATLIASAADGGMRDALSILDLCASSKDIIDESTVAAVCSMAGNEYLLKLTDYIKAGNSQGCLMLIDELHNSSVDMLRLLTELIKHFRDLMIVKTVKGDNIPIICSKERLEAINAQAALYDIKEILSILSTLQASTINMQNGDRRSEMEMTLLRLCNPAISKDISSLEMRIAKLESALKNGINQQKNVFDNEIIKSEPVVADEEIPLPEEENLPPAPISESEPYVSSDENSPIRQWEEILLILKRTCPLIAGVLQGSKAYISDDRLLIDTQNSQFKALFNGPNPMYRDSIRKAAAEVLGKSYKLGPYRPKESKIEEDPLIGFAKILDSLENNN